jgi:protein TonB
VARSAPTSPANLLAAARAAPPAVAASAEQTAAVRVAAAPDPYLEGRAVYALSVQMPNVTSYSGSWILWFAERGRAGSPGAVLSPPVPLRKVDPKYIPSAAAERVEGRVRLAAVIRSDGRVDSVVLLRAVDERLDRSAEEALRKWLFEPAQRGGQPVDVDAVVEIPFRLAPLSSQP